MVELSVLGTIVRTVVVTVIDVMIARAIKRAGDSL
ncbi:MAG: hypothetical protein RLZZ450_2500 [Pseudomonadota bacterium]|jgi:hypothetical protein